jgi:hypothetical protein
MPTNKKKKEVLDSLTEDKARSDASYSYDKGSIEPVAEGAFKGALSSSIASRIARESKTLSKFLPSKKLETSLVGLGTVAGAVAGKSYNNKKVDDAKKAREWLSDKRKRNDYIKKTRDIYKQSAVNPEEYVSASSSNRVIPTEQGKNRLSWGDIAKDTALWGAGGMAFGALGAMKPFKALRALKFAHDVKPRMITSAAKWGGLLGAGTLAPEVAEKLSQDAQDASGVHSEDGSAAGAALDGAILFGASGAIEPTVNKAIGRYILPRYDKAGTITKEYLKDAEAGIAKNKSPKTLLGKTKRYIPFGGPSAADAREVKSGLDAAKKGAPFFKGLLKPTIQKGSRYALGGAALMYGASKLTDYLKNRSMEKTASLTGAELVAAKKADAKDTIDSSRIASIARKGGVAAAAFVLGKKLGGTTNAGLKAAKLTALYSIPKLIHEEYNRGKAKKFLKKSYPGKLSDVKSEEDRNRFGTSNLVDAYLASRIIDSFNPPDREVHIKTKPKKKFDIGDALH